MPTIFDNDQSLLRDGLLDAYKESKRADCCIGYFNLRGWGQLADAIDLLPGNRVNENGKEVHRTCRLLIGMMVSNPYEHADIFQMDHAGMKRQKELLAIDFRRQLERGCPSNTDEKTVQHLKKQLEEGKVVIKFYLRSRLHAKLYLAHRTDTVAPLVAFVGSSNLTFSGLKTQGELNVDVLEQDAARKLDHWFNERWNDSQCVDITKELIEILDESWGGKTRRPYEIFIKIAYHLSYEARMGLANFSIPQNFKNELLDFQETAVAVAARHLNQRGGVLVGDVVGLGKTIVATAIAKIFENDFNHETLVICPKNLTDMWKGYLRRYYVRGEIMSVSRVQNDLPNKERYRTVIIDESHNLRNREGARYKAIKDYIDKNDCKVILLSATPYNKTYKDLANQLRLFLDEDVRLTISPIEYIRSFGGQEAFDMKHTETSAFSLGAFALSEFPGDWQKLMQHYLVRRTRNFIKKHYAKTDETGRKSLQFADGRMSPFPDRLPKRAEFPFDSSDNSDQYAQLYSGPIVDTIGGLHLSRYGLQLYRKEVLPDNVTAEEIKLLDHLNRAQRRLIGFCRTMLFKRLESSGASFLLSLSRHLLRNYVFIYALENNLPIPLGKNSAQNIDDYLDNDEDNADDETLSIMTDPETFLEKGKEVYSVYRNEAKKYDWIQSDCFTDELLKDLKEDSNNILGILKENQWKPKEDRKLNALYTLVTKTHGNEKVLVFTQFADTAKYLHEELKNRGVAYLECVTGRDGNPTEKAYRFSPKSNDQIVCTADEIRVLISTDVLSEGQNLQDCRIVVNYDLPWAIIRLIQRAGRVDRIGQQATEILCYSFWPEEGIEKIIHLRSRLDLRIKQHTDVLGSDEQFFEGDPINLENLYNEKSGILDDDENDAEVDISSHALKIWQEAIENNPALEAQIKKLPNVVHSTKKSSSFDTPGVITYVKTKSDDDMLVWVDDDGEIVTLSQMEILKAAECFPETPSLEKSPQHNDLIAKIVERMKRGDRIVSAAMGTRLSVKRWVYERLEHYCRVNPLIVSQELKEAMQDIHNHKMMESAKEAFLRQRKAGATDAILSELAENLHNEHRLVFKDDTNTENKEPEIICSLGIRNN